MEDRSPILTIRLPLGLVEKIDEDIEKHKEFRNRSEFITMAVRHYIDYRLQMRPDQ